MTTTQPTIRPQELAAGDPDGLVKALADHPFTDGFDAAHLRLMAQITSQIELEAGRYLFRHNQPADALFLLTDGDVALELPRGDGHLTLETLHGGDALGWSWLYAPYHWHLDAVTTTDVTALAVDAVRLRQLFTADPRFGLEVTWRVGATIATQLQHARDQLAARRTGT